MSSVYWFEDRIYGYTCWHRIEQLFIRIIRCGGNTSLFDFAHAGTSCWWKYLHTAPFLQFPRNQFLHTAPMVCFVGSGANVFWSAFCDIPALAVTPYAALANEAITAIAKEIVNVVLLESLLCCL